MLMRCEGCGRMFDYEKNDGVCPGCGRFCQNPDLSDSSGADGPGGTSGSGPAAAAGADAAVQTGPNAVVWPVLFLLLALLWAGAMAGGFWLLRRQQASLPARAAFASPVADEVSGGFRCRGRAIAVTGAELLRDCRAGLPEGGCLVRVGLRLDETAWQENADCFYLQSGGCFYQASDSWALEQIYPALARTALDEYELQSPEAAEGWLYFALPEPPADAALYLEQAVGYGGERRVSGAAVCPLRFVEADAEGGDGDA